MKKAQITVFVILGIVILILVGLALFVRNYLTLPDKPVLVDKEMQPLKQGIEECLYLSGKQGLIKIGLQGGFVNPRRYNLNPNPAIPTMSNSFLFDSSIEDFDDATILPYWAYMASGNDCTSSCGFSSQRPLLYSRYGSLAIEAQLDDYITENSRTCIDEVIADFQSKNYNITEKNQNNINNINDFIVKTTIAEKDVLIELQYPLIIKSRSKTHTLSRFETELGINFKKIYDTATRIVNVISNPSHPYLERLTIESIAPYALTSNSELPPIAQTVESFGAKGKSYWALPAVQEKIIEIIGDNTGNIQIQGSLNNIMPLVIFDETKKNLYNNYYLSLDSREYKFDVSQYLITFNYVPWWPAYIKIRPSSGAVIKPEKATSFFPFSVMFKKYIFYYDISYPVMIQIIDPDAFFGEGYAFQFGYEVNVRNTKPMAGDFTLFDIPAEKMSLFCDENQKKSGLIEVISKDKATNQPLPALIYYSCGRESCEIGETALDLSGGVSRLKKGFPLCIDGMVTPSLEGYFGHSSRLSTQKDVEASTEVYLEKYMDMRVKVKKMLLGETLFLHVLGHYYSEWGLLEDRIYDLGNDEWGIVTLTRMPETGEAEFIQVFEFRQGEPIEDIELITGKYTVEITLFKDLGPGKALNEVRFEGFCKDTDDGEVCVDPIVFDSSFVMGSIIIDENLAFEITDSDLSRDRLTFYVPGINLDDVNSLEDDIDALELSHITYSESPTEAILPKFS